MALLPTFSATAHGQITIASVNLNSPCFRVMNFQVIAFTAAEQRGSDVPIPHVAGVKARRRRVTATEHTIEMFIAGDVDSAGSTFANRFAGLESNCNVLLGLAEPATGDGTKSMTITFPSTATATTDVHVLGFTPGVVTRHVMAATLDISIPAGRA